MNEETVVLGSTPSAIVEAAGSKTPAELEALASDDPENFNSQQTVDATEVATHVTPDVVPTQPTLVPAQDLERGDATTPQTTITPDSAAVAEKENDKKRSTKSGTNSIKEPLTLDFTDEFLAREFSAKHSKELKYTAERNRWFHWNGSYWEPDRVLKAYDKVRHFAKAKAESILENNPETAMRLASAATVANIQKLARSDARHTIQQEQWDTNAWIISTPNGTVDLKTGELHDALPEDYSSKITSVAPVGDAPLWLRVLEDITGGDVALQQYLQRLAGYLLTGSTKEHALFFLYGPGGNGKSTFLETLREIMKDYATTVPLGALMASKNERHPTELAKLHGSRMAVATETELGGTWDEVRIKQLSGGDMITARFMRQDFFEFLPHFKLIVAGNNKPHVAKVDDAIRRRFHIIPFTQAIENPDKDLRNKLRAELSGIFKWMIEGALEWQRQGLNPPESVLAATQDYLSEEDTVGQWVEECCELAKDAQSLSAELFASWQKWCAENDADVGAKKTLTQRLSEFPGITTVKIGKKRARGLRGIRLKPECGGLMEGIS